MRHLSRSASTLFAVLAAAMASAVVAAPGRAEVGVPQASVVAASPVTRGAGVGPGRAAALLPGSRATVAVTVATLWRRPGIERWRDLPSSTNPVRLAAWNRNLRTTAQRRWLVPRIQTQALYNQEVIVLERSGRWVRVAVPDEPDPQDPRGYPGWMPVRQLRAGAPDPDQDVVVLARKTRLRLTDGSVAVGYGTRFHAVGRDGSRLVVASPDGTGWLPAAAAGPPPQATRRAIMAAGRQFLGLRYLWGGLSPWGFDCSGLVWDLFRAHGVDIPRDADPQFRAGKPVGLRHLRRGDLLFWGTPSYVHHVALYAGHGRMMEAPDSSGEVRIVPVRKAGLTGARRYLSR